MTTKLNTTLFLNWLRQAPPGERTIYHKGNLAADRLLSARLNERADAALLASQQGLVKLTQLRYFELSAAAKPRSEALSDLGYGYSYVYIAERTALPIMR